MREDLEQQLYERYPIIFKDHQIPMQCGDGWYGILDCMFGRMQAHIIGRQKSIVWATRQQEIGKLDGQIPPRVEAVIPQQIKEKFGTLRVYYNGGDDAIHGISAMAEAMSSIICEECGNSGTIRNGTWVRTLCNQHHVKRGLGASDEFMA